LSTKGPRYTNAQKIAAIRRELALRRPVYAKRVAQNIMLQTQADYQIGIFEEILEDYLLRGRQEQPTLPLLEQKGT